MKATYEWALKALKRRPEGDSQTIIVFESSGAFFGYDREDHHLAYIISKKDGKYHYLCEHMIQGFVKRLGGIPIERLSDKIIQQMREDGLIEKRRRP